MTDYDIFFKGSYFGTAYSMSNDNIEALEYIQKEFDNFGYFDCDEDDIHIEKVGNRNIHDDGELHIMWNEQTKSYIIKVEN